MKKPSVVSTSVIPVAKSKGYTRRLVSARLERALASATEIAKSAVTVAVSKDQREILLGTCNAVRERF